MKFERYFIFIFFGVLVLFAVVLFAIYSEVKEKTINEMNVNQTIHARQAATGIKDYINNAINSLNFLSRLPEVKEMNIQGKRLLADYKNHNSDEIMSITRVDAQGKIIYTYPYEESIEKDISQQDHIQLIIKTHRIVVSDVFMAVQGFRTVAVHVPVFRNNTFDGTIAFLLSFDKIAQKYIENIRIGTSGYAWVVSEKGIEISSPFLDHIGKNVYDTYKEYHDIISMITEMLKGKEGVATYRYIRTKEYSENNILKHAVYMPIVLENTFWSIVVATPEDEVIASLSGFRTNLLIITIVLITICVICLYLIVRFQIVKREQQKREIILSDLKKSEESYKILNAELENRVAKRTEQLEAANKELEAFSYSVSHDLRAPLRHTSGYIDLLAKKCNPDLSEKGQHYLNSMKDSVHQMGLLIDDLLRFSKTGRAEMHRSFVDMNEIVKEVKKSLIQYNPNRNIEWIDCKLPSLFCDAAMIKLVWMNLLSNAIKYTKTREPAKIEIGVIEEEKEYVFYVRDNGVGFDMQYAKKLFGVFQRLHSMEEYEGTGIGLANVRRIIARHEGRTWAEAELNKGATFYFTLPTKS